MLRHGLALHIADNDLMCAPLPKWWGFAYRKFHVRYTVLYPIPINLVVRYSLKLYWLVYSWVSMGGWEDKLEDAYWQGFNEGNTRKEHDLERLARRLIGKEEGRR